MSYPLLKINNKNKKINQMNIKINNCKTMIKMRFNKKKIINETSSLANQINRKDNEKIRQLEGM